MMLSPVDVLLMLEPVAFVVGIVGAVIAALLACFGALMLWTSRTVKGNRAPGLVLLIIGLCVSGMITYLLVVSH